MFKCYLFVLPSDLPLIHQSVVVICEFSIFSLIYDIDISFDVELDILEYRRP